MAADEGLKRPPPPFPPDALPESLKGEPPPDGAFTRGGLDEVMLPFVVVRVEERNSPGTKSVLEKYIYLVERKSLQ